MKRFVEILEDCAIVVVAIGRLLWLAAVMFLVGYIGYRLLFG